MMRLYIYEHCPFCIRPRIIAGIKEIPLTTACLANDDEKAHLDLIGKKQVPFLQKDDGSFLIESLNICQYLNTFDQSPILSTELTTTKSLMNLVNELSNASKSLVYPRFLEHPQNHEDFPTQSAKDYFEHKKEKYIGCFKANLRFSKAAIEKIDRLLVELKQLMIFKFAGSDVLSWDDIMVFPALRNLTIIGDLVKIPVNIGDYIHRLSKYSGIQLYSCPQHF